MRKEMQDGFASLQRQMLDTSSGPGEREHLSHDETSPKWGVTLPVKSLEELDVLENQLAEDEDLEEEWYVQQFYTIELRHKNIRAEF